jgi:ADP-ribose pyrophosphatase YjhB (NUDIX family)
MSPWREGDETLAGSLVTEAAVPLSVNVAVIDARRRVLLTRREDFEVWCLPGGAVDPGESLAEAAIREVREETGLDVELSRLVGLYSRPRLGGYHTLALFAAEQMSGSLRPDPVEVIELAWFGEGELPADLLWGQRERLDDALAGTGGSIVRTTDYVRPEYWPTRRDALYEQRDASGLSRLEYYRQFVQRLGQWTSRVEVRGRVD